jgi:hypothetical protein
MTPGK